MSAITWVNTDPTDGSNASGLDDSLRNFALSVSSGLGESLNWPGTAGGSAASAGFANAGSARLAYGGGMFGNAPGPGFLSFDTYRGALVEGSGLSNLLGHASMLVRPYSSETSSVWRYQSGSHVTTVSTAIFAVSFASAYSGTPHVALSVSTPGVITGLAVVDGSGFTSRHSWMAGSASTWTIYWSSEGTMAVA